MKPGRWLMAHWPGAEMPGTKPDGAEPDGIEPVGAGGEALEVWPEDSTEPVATRFTLVCAAVARWVTAPVRGGWALVRKPSAWIVGHWPGHYDLPDLYGPPAPATGDLQLRAEMSVVPASLDPSDGDGPVDVGDGEDVGGFKLAGPGPGKGRRRSRRWLRRPRRVPLLGLRQIATVFSAVYTALADPIVGADQEVRERRAAQARRVGMAAASVALAALLLYAIFPVRAFFDQWDANRRQQNRLDVLTEQNQRLEDHNERLQTDEEVERIAREQHGLIYPGEEPYVLLPAPEE